MGDTSLYNGNFPRFNFSGSTLELSSTTFLDTAVGIAMGVSAGAVFLISQVLGITTCAMAIYQGCFKSKFNWHIVVTTVGMVYVFGFKLLTYRLLRWLPIRTLHLFHAGTGVIILLATIFGYLTAYKRTRTRPGAAHLSTTHDWVALLSSALFVTQWVFSMTAYLYPKLSVSLRIDYLPFHVFIGYLTFVLVVVAALLGLSELQHLEKVEKGFIITMGLLLTAFATLVIYLSTTPAFQRVSLEHE